MEPAERPDAAVDRIASGQHGAISYSQLMQAGLSRRAVQRRVEAGRLHALFHGVYRVGPALSPRTLEMGAVLACGACGVLSHRSAGAIWQCSAALAGAIEVSVSRSVRRRIKGVLVHRSRSLVPRDVTTREQLPITTPERTLLDLATVLPSTDLERAVARAEQAGLVRIADLVQRVESSRGQPGVVAMRRLLQQVEVPALTRSEAEARLLELVRRGRLTRPQVNAALRGYEVDFLWLNERVVVEVDGFAYHSSPRAFSRDRRRDAELAAAGFRVLRFTWDDIAQQPEATLVTLTRTLALNGARHPAPDA
jgi:very-short-patch-repair endonuclease